MPVNHHHSQVCTNGSPAPGKCQDCGMDEQKKDGLGEVSFHFHKNEKMVQKWPATARALKGEWPGLNQISFKWCGKLCSAPLQFLTVTHSASLAPPLRLWSQTLTFQELPRKHQGVPRWEEHRRSTASQSFLTNWGESFSEHGWGLKAEQLQSHFWLVAGMLQGGPVPAGTSPTMAFISSDPLSHPHNGKKIKSSFNYLACTVLWLYLDAQNDHVWKKINQ